VRWWELGIRISDRRDTDTDDDLHLETSTYRIRRSAERSRAGTCLILTLRLHVSGSEFLLHVKWMERKHGLCGYGRIGGSFEGKDIRRMDGVAG
jgi:hypothetical protein